MRCRKLSYRRHRYVLFALASSYSIFLVSDMTGLGPSDCDGGVDPSMVTQPLIGLDTLANVIHSKCTSERAREETSHPSLLGQCDNPNPRLTDMLTMTW